MTLEEMKNVDIRTVDKDTLVDLRSVKIDRTKPVEERIRDYMSQIKNPYCFKVGDIAVKVHYSENGGSFEKLFKEALSCMF